MTAIVFNKNAASVAVILVRITRESTSNNLSRFELLE